MPESFDWQAGRSRTSRTVRRYERRKRIDLERQILYVDLVIPRSKVQPTRPRGVEPWH
jgi:hypothetical protein